MSSGVVIPRTGERILEKQSALVIPAYLDAARQYRKGALTLGVGDSKVGGCDGEFTGSNPFIALLLANLGKKNPGTFPSGHRLPYRRELEEAAKIDPDFFKRIGVDYGLAIVSAFDEEAPYNNPLSERLARELKERNIYLGKGRLIQLPLLDLVRADNPYGLAFTLNGKATEETVRSLEEFSWDSPPNSGLSRVFFYNGSEHLADKCLSESLTPGRVIGIKEEKIHTALAAGPHFER